MKDEFFEGWFFQKRIGGETWGNFIISNDPSDENEQRIVYLDDLKKICVIFDLIDSELKKALPEVPILEKVNFYYEDLIKEFQNLDPKRIIWESYSYLQMNSQRLFLVLVGLDQRVAMFKFLSEKK